MVLADNRHGFVNGVKSFMKKLALLFFIFILSFPLLVKARVTPTAAKCQELEGKYKAVQSKIDNLTHEGSSFKELHFELGKKGSEERMLRFMDQNNLEIHENMIDFKNNSPLAKEDLADFSKLKSSLGGIKKLGHSIKRVRVLNQFIDSLKDYQPKGEYKSFPQEIFKMFQESCEVVEGKNERYCEKMTAEAKRPHSRMAEILQGVSTLFAQSSVDVFKQKWIQDGNAEKLKRFKDALNVNIDSTAIHDFESKFHKENGVDWWDSVDLIEKFEIDMYTCMQSGDASPNRNSECTNKFFRENPNYKEKIIKLSKWDPSGVIKKTKATREDTQAKLNAMKEYLNTMNDLINKIKGTDEYKELLSEKNKIFLEQVENNCESALEAICSIKTLNENSTTIKEKFSTFLGEEFPKGVTKIANGEIAVTEENLGKINGQIEKVLQKLRESQKSGSHPKDVIEAYKKFISAKDECRNKTPTSKAPIASPALATTIKDNYAGERPCKEAITLPAAESIAPITSKYAALLKDVSDEEIKSDLSGYKELCTKAAKETASNIEYQNKYAPLCSRVSKLIRAIVEEEDEKTKAERKRAYSSNIVKYYDSKGKVVGVYRKKGYLRPFALAAASSIGDTALWYANTIVPQQFNNKIASLSPLYYVVPPANNPFANFISTDQFNQLVEFNQSVTNFQFQTGITNPQALANLTLLPSGQSQFGNAGFNFSPITP